MDSGEAYSDAVSRAVEAVGPAVVQVDVSRRPPSAETYLKPFPEARSGLGSGVIIRPDGHLVTNARALHGARQIRIGLHDGRAVTGRLVGRDRPSDLAIIKIDAEDLAVAELGDSETLRVGQLVVAIGNPLGLRCTATAGVVSALGRSVRAGRGWILEELIQTDASINSSNSGGPLVDTHGRIIGINTAMPWGALGISFAVASRVVRDVFDEIVVRGHRNRSWLGIGGHPTRIDQETAARFSLPRPTGLLILDVVANSPAERCGIEPLDVLCAFNGEPVPDIADLQGRLRAHPPGEVVVLTILRGEKLLERMASLAVLPER